MLKTAFLAALALVCVASTAEAQPRTLWKTYAAHPDCNVTMPCEGVITSKRGELVVKAMHGFGSARKTYTPRVAPRNEVRAVTPSIGGGGLVSTARAYLGQTASQIGLRRTLWCSASLRHITHAAGVDDRAISWSSHQKVSGAVGTIAIVGHHHVGLVSGFDAAGNPIIISGNHGGRVREAVYPRNRILAFVSPS